jgi:hypothetical protein
MMLGVGLRSCIPQLLEAMWMSRTYCICSREISVYEWRVGEELGGRSEHKLERSDYQGAMCTLLYIRKRLPNSGQQRETSDHLYSLHLGLKEIDPDIYAVTQVVLIASKPPPKADQLHPVVAEMRDMSKAFYNSLIFGAFYVFVVVAAVNWLPKLFDWAFGFGRSRGLW